MVTTLCVAGVLRVQRHVRRALYACQDRYNHRIRKIDFESGETTTLAGSGPGGYNNHKDGFKYLKDDAVGTSAGFHFPNGIAIDPEGTFALVAVCAWPASPRRALPQTAPLPPTHAPPSYS